MPGRPPAGCGCSGCEGSRPTGPCCWREPRRLAGRDDRAKALAGILRRQFPAAAAVVGESRRNLADFVDATLAAPRPPVRLAVGEGWSGLGGVSGPTPPDAKAGIVLATRWVNPPLPEKGKALELVAQFAARPEREGYRISPVLRKGQVLLAKTALPAAVYPVVAGEGAIYRSDSHVTACDLLTGQALWSLRLPLYREPKEVADTGWVFMQNSQGEETALADPGGHLMTLADGVLFVRYGIPNSASGSDTASGLAAVATGPAPAGGTLIWEVGFRAGEGFLHDLQFTSAPTVAHGRVFVVGYQALKCYLVCLEAATGKLLWRRWICDAPREGGQANMPWGRFRAQQAHSYQRSSPPAVAGSTVLVLPNNGLLVALDAAAGGLLWARRYDGPPEPNNDYGVGESDWGATRGSGGPINPVLVLGDRVICLPADRASLLALDIHDGRAIWGKGDPNRFTLRFLCALDPERILLAGPGLEVRSAATGEVCHTPLDIQDVTGRPARMGRFVLASGVGRLHRLDLGDYSHAALPLEDPRGLLGNLAVSGQTLLAANAAGLCAYFEYDDACRRLDDRIAKSPRADVGPLLLQRALLAFHAKAFDRVAADLDAARAAAREQFDAALLEQAGLWTHRLAVARGNHAPTTAEAIDWFQKARQTASTDEDKAAAMLRLAKAYETAAPPAAAALAQELAEAFPVTLIPDVAIGVNAPAWSAPESDEPFAPASDRAQALIAALIARHGRDCYAGFDREAAAALEKARTDQNPQAALDVAQRWPQSLAVPAARYAAAELFCLQALKNSDHREENLCEAFAQLSQLAASDDPTLSLQARLAVRVIR
ncbi:MAG: PQQ-binding-like beta-propeller repeat protein, partial [Planctomycetota bacterium]|nr:PQQ-binding-like beta-propeller repeat protein [Planctomycetota bacterium]